MRVERRVTLNADRETVWKVLGDPGRYPALLPHLERWEPVTKGPPGVGSRYTVMWHIGAIPVGENSSIGIEGGDAVISTEINGSRIDLRVPIANEAPPEPVPAPP